MSKEVDGQRLSMSRARVAVLGYGPDAKQVAAGLRRAGNDVTVGLGAGGMSWVRAQRDGFVSKPSPIAVEGAEVVAVHIPDQEQCSVYWHVVAPNVAASALLVFGRALALATGALEPRDCDVVVVTGDPSACRVAVHTDATGRALERAVAYARAAFGPYAQIGTSTVEAEAERELAALELAAGGRDKFFEELDRATAHARESHAPDEARLAYYEGLHTLLGARARISESGVRLAAEVDAGAGLGARRGVA